MVFGFVVRIKSFITNKWSQVERLDTPLTSLHLNLSYILQKDRHVPISHEQFSNTSNMDSESGNSGDNVSSETEDNSDDETVKRKKPSATHQATKLVSHQSLSTNKASNVCASLAE